MIFLQKLNMFLLFQILLSLSYCHTSDQSESRIQLITTRNKKNFSLFLFQYYSPSLISFTFFLSISSLYIIFWFLSKKEFNLFFIKNTNPLILGEHALASQCPNKNKQTAGQSHHFYPQCWRDSSLQLALLKRGSHPTVTQRLGGPKVVPQHPIIPFKKLRPFNMRPESAEFLNLQRGNRNE